MYHQKQEFIDWHKVKYQLIMNAGKFFSTCRLIKITARFYWNFLYNCSVLENVICTNPFL